MNLRSKAANQYMLKLPASSRGVLALVATSVLTVLFASTWKRYELDARSLRAVEADQAEQSARSSPPTVLPRSMSVPDFTQGLPSTVSAHGWARHLQTLAAQNSVGLISVDLVEKPATPQKLGATDLSINLHGEYPRLKLLLVQLQAKYPQSLVRRLSLRQSTQGPGVDAALTVSLPTRPVAALEAGHGR